MAALLLFFIFSIVISFLCSVWEAVLLSVTPTYVSRMEREKPITGKLLNRFKEDIDRPLSAILTLNTIAHTVGAVGVGVEAGKIFGPNYLSLYFIEIPYESVIAGLMTLAILVLSEIIPKTIGATYWKNLTPFTVRSLRVLIVVLAPFVWLSKFITRLIKTEKGRSVFSRADFAAMADAGHKSGALDRDEKSIIQNLLRLENLKVRGIMTPRSVLMMVDEEMPIDQIYKEFKPMVFSRIPVYSDSVDSITGYVLKYDVLEKLADDEFNLKLKDVKREMLVTYESFTIPKLFEQLLDKKEHIALIVDEYGGVEGIATLEDVFETLFGFEITDETDMQVDMQKLARERWLKRAKAMNIDFDNSGHPGKDTGKSK